MSWTASSSPLVKRHPHAHHNRLALEPDTMDHTRRMADGGDRFSGVLEGLDQRD
jgi:hypothetical protein